jgi:hypothetical protein
MENYADAKREQMLSSQVYTQGLVTIHVNILSLHKHVQGRTPFLPLLALSRPVWFNSQDLILLKKYHDLPSTTSCEGAAVVFVRNSPK